MPNLPVDSVKTHKLPPFKVSDILDTFDYDPENGALYLKGTQDKVPTYSDSGGLFVRIAGKAVAVHRLCWCVHHKQWPAFYLRHLNGDSSDNRIINLARARWDNDPSRQPAAVATAKPGW